MTASQSPPLHPTERGRTVLPLLREEELDKSIWDADLAMRSAAKGELRSDLLKQSRAPLSSIALVTASYLALSLGYLGATTRFQSPSTIPTTLGLALSGVWFAVSRAKSISQGAERDLGHLFFLLICCFLAAMRHGSTSELSIFTLSPSTLLILAYAALIPVSPRRAGGLYFGAAAADPLALMLKTGSLVSLPFCFASVGAVGGVAWILSRAIHQLHEGIEQAQLIGGYRLESRLGVGGMAEVWRGSHRLLQRPAAVKLIRPEILLRHGEQGALRLLRIFLKEARATSRLSSPHTIELYDFGITREGSFFYVMELLDGVDLKRLVEKGGPIPAERAAYLLEQVARSLEEAHAENLVHRDLKPANVFSCKMGSEYDFAKVLDFGLVLDRHPTAEEIEDESLVGTPTVMAPEMVRFQSKVDARADIYSLGCIGYFLVTGHNVFEAQTRADMLVMHAHQKPVLPSKRLGAPVHPGFEALVMSCLEKNPEKRPQNATEVRALLRAISFPNPWTEERARLAAHAIL